MTDWDDDILSEDETDENIIELTDIVNEGSGLSTEEAIIELTDIVEDESADFDLDIVKEDSFEVEKNLDLEDGISFNQGPEFETNDPIDDGLIEPEEFAEPVRDFAVNQEQIEAALERVIEKKFADKIESILFEVMEKVIEKEIAEIKESLQKDLDHIGNV